MAVPQVNKAFELNAISFRQQRQAIRARPLRSKMAPSHEDILDALRQSQNSYEFSILKLSEPISGPLKQNAGERTSDVSADVFENPSPASLEADLAHYKACHSRYYDLRLC